MKARVTQLGRYELRAVLASGAVSTVHEAWDHVIARRVAIKLIDLPDAGGDESRDILARFRRSAQAAACLQHPNIVALYDYGETAEVAFIVMEFVEGVTLEALLESRKRLTAADALPIMEGVLAGLQYGHERGIIHRDIKPANIMLTVDRCVKIADFGIARIESSNLTQVGTAVGTLSYMSPEQFTGEPIDLRTDIYSSGVMLYRVLTGERPFDDGPATIMNKVLHSEPRRVSDLAAGTSQALDVIVARAMARRPGDRFASAQEFRQTLRAAFGEAKVLRTGGITATERLAVRHIRPSLSGPRGYSSYAALAAGTAVGFTLVMGLWYSHRPLLEQHPALTAVSPQGPSAEFTPPSAVDMPPSPPPPQAEREPPQSPESPPPERPVPSLMPPSAGSPESKPQPPASVVRLPRNKPKIPQLHPQPSTPTWFENDKEESQAVPPRAGHGLEKVVPPGPTSEEKPPSAGILGWFGPDANGKMRFVPAPSGPATP